MMSKQKQEWGFKTEPLVRGEEDELFKLLGLCFGDVNPKFFEWKYEKYPGLESKNTIAIKKDHTLIGAVTLWPMKTRVTSDLTIDVLVAGGGATHPHFRRRGIYSTYMRRAQSFSKETGASLLIGYVSTANITYKILPKLGMHELLTQHYYMKILDYPHFFKDAIHSREFENIKQLSKLSQKLKEYDEDILIIPRDGNPFTMEIKDGKIQVSSRTTENPIATLKGDICAILFAKNFAELLKVLITRKIKVWIPIGKIWKSFKIFLALLSVL